MTIICALYDYGHDESPLLFMEDHGIMNLQSVPSLVSVSHNNVSVSNGSTSLTENTQMCNTETGYACSFCDSFYKTEGE